ncbi:hypothetical protein F5I97DRAFT_1515129 [Phlebopus sp. FC_14]|nr:hypothetical protein F5I97DRAFT_1515129 [Phlebopus sp. FC_14]
MSARQAFIPRSQSRENTDTLHNGQTTNLPGDIFTMKVNGPQASLDTDKPTETESNGDGKVRSLAGLMGKKKAANPAAARGSRPGQGQGQMQTPRRSFEGIHRPEMTPISIIPYPTPHPDTFTGQYMQPSRKAMAPDSFSFPTSTPLPGSRGMKNGLDVHDNEREEGEKGSQKGLIYLGAGDNESNLDTGGSVSGYMRVFSRPGSGGSVVRPSSGEQRIFGAKIAAPSPGYARAAMEMGTQMEMEGAGEMYARRSRSLEGIQEEVDRDEVNGDGDATRTLRRVKRGLGREEIERGEDSVAGVERREGHWSAKRTRHDLQEEYTRLSSPRMHPTPAPPMPPPLEADQSCLTLASLFENVGDFVNEDEFERMCKQWTECTREDWLKGAEELTGELTTILNLVKDHLTEQVMSYANLAHAVEERRADLDSCTETLQDGMCNIKDNLTKLATKK